MRGPARSSSALLLILLLSVAATPERRPDRPPPGPIPAHPSFVGRVEGSLVGLRVRVDPRSPSAQTLGTQRFATGTIFDPRGYVVTVSYAVLEAASIEVVLRSGQTLPGRLVGIDFDSGLGVVGLDGQGPWRPATLGTSAEVAVGATTSTVSVDEDGGLVPVTGSLQTIRSFAAYWEYRLERAFFTAPANPSWSGGAVVNARGEVIAVASLRLGEKPFVNLSIPLETFVPIKDELITQGQVTSRPPRPWLGLYTVSVEGAVIVDGFSPIGPARKAGFRRGDRVVSVNGTTISGHDQFYEALWRGQAGDVVRITVADAEGARVIEVKSVDRRQLFRTTSP